MSNRDPHLPTNDTNGTTSHNFNPSVSAFHPPPTNKMTQVSPTSHYNLEHVVHHLEREQLSLRGEVDDLYALYSKLDASVEILKKGGWDITVGPFRDQSAKQMLDRLDADMKSCANDEVKKDSESLPPHLRAASMVSNASCSVPPHLRGKMGTSGLVPPRVGADGGNVSVQFRPVRWSATDRYSVRSDPSDYKSGANDPLITDGKVDDAVLQAQKTPTAEPTPPSSPHSRVQSKTGVPSVEDISLNNGPESKSSTWQPHYITTLPPLPTPILSTIPSLESMTSFSPDFLLNTFSGIPWSPGLNFIPPSPGPCFLRNRTYYTVNSTTDPYLPAAPGTHGAKLIPFFNTNPEDEYADQLPPDFPSTASNVPLFIMRPDARGRQRYFYYGHYTQSRWSDRLDHDAMQSLVPLHVRSYWAEELSASGRPAWMTEKLRQHFFPAPEYEGALFGTPVEEGGSVASEDLGRREEKVGRGVRRYVEVLRGWEREARMKTSLIKKDFILQAFDRADADDPPALRLWWEYLECNTWNAEFYNLLVTLQGRSPNYERY